jgi:hypothetical protein
MTEDVPHLDQASSRLDHVGRRIVPQVVPFEIGYALSLVKTPSSLISLAFS